MKYSENLAKFIKGRRTKAYDRVFLHKHDEAGNPVTSWEMRHIVLGFADDTGAICGAYLNRIMCGYPQTGSFSGLARQVVDITDEFWREYQRDGRCVIDRGHTGWFANDKDRFTVIANTRRCNWCGEWHARTFEKRTKIERQEVWAPEKSISEAA